MQVVKRLTHVIVIVLTLVIVRPKLTATELLLVVVFGCFALRNARNAPTFALVVVPILAKPIESLVCFGGSIARMASFGEISGEKFGVLEIAMNEKEFGGRKIVLHWL